MQKEIVIDIAPGGQAQGMNFDQFDLGILGKKKITRASEIIFNETTQLWDVWLPGADKASVTGFSGYDIARSFEVDWLQGCRKAQIDPRSMEGADMAMAVVANQDDFIKVIY